MGIIIANSNKKISSQKKQYGKLTVETALNKKRI